MNSLFRLARSTTLAVLLIFAASSGAAFAKDLDPGGGQSAEVLQSLEALPDLLSAVAAQGWVNQSGSVMNFTVNSDMSIVGSYINNAAGTGCQGTSYPLSGWINGNNIAWTVSWSNPSADCNSVTGWAGYYDPNSDSIISSWSLAYQSGSGGQIQLGNDTFTYQ
jgi:hypothetical protein